MSTHIIVDGYNLIRHSPDLAPLDREDLQAGRDALITMLAEYKRVKKHRITVVFDGADTPSLYPHRANVRGISVLFSARGELADGVIKRMARKEGERALVVSSDREVQRYSHRHRATVIDSGHFEQKLLMAGGNGLGAVYDGDETGWQATTRKKGPSRRTPKRKRRHLRKMRKL